MMADQTRAQTKMKIARRAGMLILVATVTYITGTELIDTILSTPDYLLHIYPNKIQVLLSVFL